MSSGSRKPDIGVARSLGEISRARFKPDLRRKAYTKQPGYRSAACSKGKCTACFSLKCTCINCHPVT